MKTSGAQANSNGNHLEEAVEQILKRNGYKEVDKSHFTSFSQVADQSVYSKQVNIGQTIYDTKRICDFIIFHPVKFPNRLIIECKWQQSSGSVDEKYPFLVLNIEELEIETIIVLDGGGFKKGADIWLRSQESDCIKKVVNLSEFMQLANEGFFN